MASVVEVDNPARVLRFYAKAIVGLDDECWMWAGALDRKGYGHMRVGPRSMSKAHIFSYTLHHGPIPAGMHVDHRCGRPGCVNPAHLRLLTNADNSALSSSPSAINARKTHCIHGHPFVGENVRWRRDGTRRCKACEHQRERGS